MIADLTAATDLDIALDDLFATPPDEFVTARNALAKRLRAEKRRDEATAVAAYRRPTRIVWALDQLALQGDPALGSLLGAVKAVRGADGSAFRAAVADLREAVGAAATAATSRLPDERMHDRPTLATTLQVIVGDAESLNALAAGRLLREPTAGTSGFGVFPGDTPVPAPRAPAKSKAVRRAASQPGERDGEERDGEERDGEERDGEEHEDERADDGKAGAEVDQTLARRRAERELRRATDAIDAASSVRTKAEAARAAAAGAAADAEQRVEEAAAALAQAEATRDQATADADRAADAFAAALATEEQAQAALDSLEPASPT